MSQHFFVFGTHPYLSLAEVKAVLGGRAPKLVGEMGVFEYDEWDGNALQNRLGGIVKLGDVIAEMPTADLTPAWIADWIEANPRGKKIEYGFTAYGGSNRTREFIEKLALKVKKELKERGHSVRWVTGEQGSVTPAAVAKAGLTTTGYDFAIGILEDRVMLGVTTHVQDADAWSHRDYDRPFRDAKTGMLPPKLARMMVNLGIGMKVDQTVLDPFCGGGATLMEAAMIGVPAVIGSDISEEQTDGSQKNIDWLAAQGIIADAKRVQIFTSPAEMINEVVIEPVDVIVTEGFLGRPLSGDESREVLERNKEEVEKIWEEALPAMAKVHRSGGRMVCVWPVYASSHGTIVIDPKEAAEKAGYRIVRPLDGWVDRPPTLTYARPDQHVKRNIVILEKK